MQQIPRPIRQLVEKFERLPGIGPRLAQRLVFYLLHNPDHEIEDFAQKLLQLKRDTVMCESCHNIAEQNPCQICSDLNRDQSVLCVVEQPLDLLAIEKSGQYNGHYHVLHGAIAPLNNIGPDQLYLRDILKRLEGVRELILATNPTMEGEATALYINEMIKKSATIDHQQLRITRIGHGLPIGADIEYADGLTLTRALEGRRNID